MKARISDHSYSIVANAAVAERDSLWFPRRVAFLLTLLAGLFLGHSMGNAQTVLAVPNGDFSASENHGSMGGTQGGNVTGVIGEGPWWGSTTGIAGLLVRPTVTIGDGFASISGMASVAAVNANNSASIFNNNIGHVFTQGLTYTLEVDFSTGAPLSATALSDSGVGVSLYSGGSEVATSFGDPSSLVILGNNEGRFTVEFTASSAEHESLIGVHLFAGRGSGLLNAGALGTITFQEVSLTVIPEPRFYGAVGGLLVLLVALRRNSRLPI